MQSWRKIFSWRAQPEGGYGWLYETHYKTDDYNEYEVCVKFGSDGKLWGPTLARTEDAAIAFYHELRPTQMKSAGIGGSLSYMQFDPQGFTFKPIRYIGPLPFEFDPEQIYEHEGT